MSENFVLYITILSYINKSIMELTFVQYDINSNFDEFY